MARGFGRQNDNDCGGYFFRIFYRFGGLCAVNSNRSVRPVLYVQRGWSVRGHHVLACLQWHLHKRRDIALPDVTLNVYATRIRLLL